MYKTNPRLKKIVKEVVSNQLRMSDPPETKETLNRLISEGYSKQKAIDLIGAVVFSHLNEMLTEQRDYDDTKFINALKQLPDIS